MFEIIKVHKIYLLLIIIHYSILIRIGNHKIRERARERKSQNNKNLSSLINQTCISCLNMHVHIYNIERVKPLMTSLAQKFNEN